MWAMFVGDETIYTVVEDVKEREIWVMWEGKGQSARVYLKRKHTIAVGGSRSSDFPETQ